jgi:hypothetical protein
LAGLVARSARLLDWVICGSLGFAVQAGGPLLDGFEPDWLIDWACC